MLCTKFCSETSESGGIKYGMKVKTRIHLAEYCAMVDLWYSISMFYWHTALATCEPIQNKTST